MKHMLLAVSGMTPQIITETLYGIYRQDPAKLPTCIEVITTQEGRERLEKNLLGDDSPLHRLQQDYQLPPISFSSSDIKVPVGDDGQPLADVRSEREQEIIADFITQHVRELTADPELTIHASLAGGRKTMGFALGYAMSLFGRPQDCLSHVLVSEPYESVPDFYYPTPESVWRADSKKSGQYDLGQATVSLASIPLVLMREEMPTRLITDKKLSYTQTVERVNRANALSADSASVTLDFARMSLHCDGEEILLKPDCFAFYSWLAQDSKKRPGEGIAAPSDELRPRELDTRLTDFIHAVCHPQQKVDLSQPLEVLLEQVNDIIAPVIADDRQRHAVDPDYKIRNSWVLQQTDQNQNLFHQGAGRDLTALVKHHKNLWDRLLRETNRALTDALGKRLASHYQISTVTSHEDEEQKRSRYDYKGLNLRPENIHFK